MMRRNDSVICAMTVLLPPKADVYGAIAHVCLGPKADIRVRSLKERARKCAVPPTK